MNASLLYLKQIINGTDTLPPFSYHVSRAVAVLKIAEPRCGGYVANPSVWVEVGIISCAQ